MIGKILYFVESNKTTNKVNQSLKSHSLIQYFCLTYKRFFLDFCVRKNKMTIIYKLTIFLENLSKESIEFISK